jgi:hypothetical protein
MEAGPVAPNGLCAAEPGFFFPDADGSRQQIARDSGNRR